MKKARRLFFAIPFDSATRNLYDRISAKIREQHPKVTTVIGNKQISTSPRYSEFATFRAQNRELNEQFVKQISEADIVIADLTHNNPNVHVELGIALMQNKNILRVTGRAISDVGFDIRNLEVSLYRDEDQLLGIITTYLDMFLEIKKLPFQDEHNPLCRKLPAPRRLKGIGRDASQGIDLLELSPDLVLRDGAVRVDFTICEAVTPEDWLGVCFRVAGPSPWLGCHMVYVRQDGRVEVALYPGPQIVKVLPAGRNMEGQQELMIEFENDVLSVQMGGVEFETDTLSHQRAGRVVLVPYRTNVEITSAEVICRDTIEWD